VLSGGHSSLSPKKTPESYFYRDKKARWRIEKGERRRFRNWESAREFYPKIAVLLAQLEERLKPETG